MAYNNGFNKFIIIINIFPLWLPKSKKLLNLKYISYLFYIFVQ